MNILREIRGWDKQLIDIHLWVRIRFFVFGVILSAVVLSCKPDPHPAAWVEEGSLTIGQYLTNNQDQYSKFYRLLVEGKMLSALYAYNPYGDNYTLFLPSDEAIDHLLEQHPEYGNFEELVKDTSFIKMLTRYHTLNKGLLTDEFPDGAIVDTTLTGDRLVSSFFAIDNNQLIKINNAAPIIKANLKMTNGYIHVISEVLQPAEVSGYDWLQQQDDYSILAQAMELAGIKKKLKWDKYTLLAEPDSIYRLYGVNKVEDLINHLTTPGMALNNVGNPFYQFLAYHILSGEYYMNDWQWGSKIYPTFSSQTITINVGLEIQINTGIDEYAVSKSASGETVVINYIRPIPERCNIFTRTGPIHSITDLMYYKPLPKGLKKVL